MIPSERLAALVGRWRILRAIRQADGARMRFAGESVWRADGGAVRCIETGTLERDGARFAARRETLWSAAAGGIDVRFADGRPFHRIAGAHARHDCPPDTYDLSYDFAAWPRWSVRWRVTGPRKAYCALTRYERLNS